MARKSEFGAMALNFHNTAVNDTSVCILCGNKTTTQCDRCGDFYCSVICQRKDWPKHRYICFPMPNLVKVAVNAGRADFTKDEEIAETPSSTNSKLSFPPNGSCVVLTGFKSSNRCYIRSTNPSIIEECQKVLNEINEFGKNSPPLAENPKINTHALALRGDKWCRVKVLGNHNNNNYRISFVDYGDISKRFVKDLRKISVPLINLPCFTHMVQLHGINKISTEANVLQSLIKYTNKEYKMEIIKQDRFGVNVKLFQWESNTLINSLIMASLNKQKDEKDSELVSNASSLSNTNNEAVNKTSVANSQINGSANKLVSESAISKEVSTDVHLNSNVNLNGKPRKSAASPRQIQLQKPCLEPPFETIPFGENDRNSNILIVDDSYIESGYIGCILEKHFDNLKESLSFLKDYNVSDQPYKPKFHEYCLAVFENEWHRAKVVEILSDDKFLVVYSDFTNEMELTSKSIRHYPMSLTLPCYTTLCCIDGLPEDMTEEQQKFLQKNCKSFTKFKIDNVRIVDDIRYVLSQELLNKMHSANVL